MNLWIAGHAAFELQYLEMPVSVGGLSCIDFWFWVKGSTYKSFQQKKGEQHSAVSSNLLLCFAFSQSFTEQIRSLPLQRPLLQCKVSVVMCSTSLLRARSSMDPPERDVKAQGCDQNSGLPCGVLPCSGVGTSTCLEWLSPKVRKETCPAKCTLGTIKSLCYHEGNRICTETKSSC